NESRRTDQPLTALGFGLKPIGNVLEARKLPTTISQDPAGVVTVEGVSGKDDLLIALESPLSPGNVQFLTDSGSAIYTNVTGIVANMRSGNDTVLLNFLSTTTLSKMKFVKVDLGAGNDTFTGTNSPTFGDEVLGGDGDDTITGGLGN